MCGVAGKINFRGSVDPMLVQRMCAAIEHRGPDSRGLYVHDGVALGIQRLAIIDVAGGDQPIFNEDGSIAVVMNGEIYNFAELREQLIGRGHKFSSLADTEVLVHLYEDYGEEMVGQLRGMFAFAIWDARRRRLFCARDRVGKKPLFWSRRGDCFWFASEVRALLEDPEVDRTLDPSALLSYLTFLYVPHPMSAFASISKLPPGCTLTVTEEGQWIHRYWALDYSQKVSGTETELQEELWAQLCDATAVRLMSEVPLGAFLSGGIDSSAVVAAMAEQMSGPVKTFSIGFADDAFDELPHARVVAERFGTDHHEFRVEPHAVEIMPKLARHYGEPFADPSAIPTFYLAELTRAHVTVALNGDGGDESFAGYDRYLNGDASPHLNWLPRPVGRAAPPLTKLIGHGRHPSSTRTRLERLGSVLAMSQAERYATSLSAFDRVRRERLLSPEFAASVDGFQPEEFLTRAWGDASADSRIDRMQATDLETYLPGDLLVKMDIATMAHSVEARSPFLDHRLMEFAATLPPELKLDGSGGKRLLKQTLRRVLPDEILQRPKMGFGVPLARWFREELRQLPGEVLLDSSTLARGYFRRSEIEDMITEHHAHINDHSQRLWVLLQFEMWHREVVEPAALSSGIPMDGSPTR
jgi:asparagine synthase (glutamine-hydrolysing)